MELANTHETSTEAVKLSLGLCKNECNNNSVLSYFIKLGKKTHLLCVQGSWMYPHPTPIPALKPGCTHDTDMSPGALKEGALQSTPPFLVKTLLQTSSP